MKLNLHYFSSLILILAIFPGFVFSQKTCHGILHDNSGRLPRPKATLNFVNDDQVIYNGPLSSWYLETPIIISNFSTELNGVKRANLSNGFSEEENSFWIIEKSLEEVDFIYVGPHSYEARGTLSCK